MNSKVEIQEKIQNKIHKLNNNNASQHSDIPIKIIKSNSGIFRNFLYVNINSSIKSSLFSPCLKTADITVFYKKGKRDLKDNYRSVSILTVLSKLNERSMFKQISEFFENIFSKNHCEFRKGYSTQQCLLSNAREMEKVCKQ